MAMNNFCNYRLVRRLAERSDVVIENFKPGSAHPSSSP
jgi:crotonobetainyl-CoA:carnitine CoA-transferase CaiB-like acyl-CoA transferase